MKSFIFPLGIFPLGLGLIFGLSPALASAWTKVVDCKNAQTVVDSQVNTDGNVEYQIVFRNQDQIGELLQTGSVTIKRLTSLSEVVLMLKPLDAKPWAWIGEDDAFRPSGIVYLVRSIKDHLVFEAHRTLGVGNGRYLILQKLGVWDFDSCRAALRLEGAALSHPSAGK